MLLNKIPVLDKGYVALVSSCNTTQTLRDLGKEYYSNETYPSSLEDLGNLTVVMKCPLFVQLELSKYDLKLITVNSNETDAYIPSGGEIGGRDRLTAEAISDDISRTTDALLINPKAYQADGADRMLSQVITPINVYTILIIQGSYSTWCKFAYQDRLPTPIATYASAVRDIIAAEWK